ncbi:eCIS core domain-containing protein [Staphylococcus hominis]|uniref:eCIS core domain-containing protein n=1 Tax=Staphylococcus hominis TaxID=1290 RepID=UPI003D05F581
MRTHGAHGQEELPGPHPRRRDDDAAAQHRAEEALAGSSPPRVMSPDALVRLQRSAGNAAVVDLLAQRQAIQRSALHGVLRAPGRPLDDHTRADMESRLDADFSNVRVHDDAAARDVADQFDARALTMISAIIPFKSQPFAIACP